MYLPQYRAHLQLDQRKEEDRQSHSAKCSLSPASDSVASVDCLCMGPIPQSDLEAQALPSMSDARLEQGLCGVRGSASSELGASAADGTVLEGWVWRARETEGLAGWRQWHTLSWRFSQQRFNGVHRPHRVIGSKVCNSHRKQVLCSRRHAATWCEGLT